jgi:hypothetical protein
MVLNLRVLFVFVELDIIELDIDISHPSVLIADG